MADRKYAASINLGLAVLNARKKYGTFELKLSASMKYADILHNGKFFTHGTTEQLAHTVDGMTRMFYIMEGK